MVLPQVSLSYPIEQGRFSRVTHPFAANNLLRLFARLACVRPAASIVLSQDQTLSNIIFLFNSFYLRLYFDVQPSGLFCGNLGYKQLEELYITSYC